MSFILSPATAIIEPIDAPVDLLTNTAAPYTSGSAYTWTITNFDSFTTYTVTTTNGTVSQASGTITYTPASSGVGGFIVNDRGISLTIVAPLTLEYLVVAGGGGGGNNTGGGGGAGWCRTATG